MPIIMNLSCLQRPIQQTNFGLFSIPTKGFNAFVELCDVFSKPSVHCGLNFSKLSNPAWVAYQYSLKLPSIIHSYKLGQVSTEQFLRNLQQTFSFINSSALKAKRAQPVVNEVTADPTNLFCIKDSAKGNLSDDEKILALLERAWNALIDISADDAAHLNELILQANDKNPIFLMSNTNELNVHSVFSQLQALGLDLKLKAKQTEINGQQLIQLFKDKPIYLVPSYLNNAFKLGTPGLLKSIFEKQNLNANDLQVVSQYPGDLKLAETLGVEKAHLHKPESFFKTEARPKPSLALT